MNILRRLKAHRRLLLRALVSGTLIAWLLTEIDLRTVIERWSLANWPLLVVLVPVLYLLNTYLRTARLRLILRTHGMQLSFGWLWLVQLKSSFVVSFVPGGVSGDVYRTFVIGRKIERTLDSISALVLEKVIGLLAMVSLSVVSLIVGVGLLGVAAYSNLIWPVAIIAGALVLFCLVSYLVVRFRLLARWRLPFSYWTRLEETADRLALQLRDGRIVLSLAVLSVLLQLSIIFWYFVVAQAKALDLSLITLLIAVPIVELLLTIPISIGGLGVRDASLVVLLQPFGLSAEEIVSLSLLVALTATLVRVLSGVAFLFDGEGQDSALQNKMEQAAETP